MYIPFFHYDLCNFSFRSCKVEKSSRGEHLYTEQNQQRCHERANILQHGRVIAKWQGPMKIVI